MADPSQLPPSRYMTFDEVSHHLGLARTTFYHKVNAGHLVMVDVGTTGSRRRITRVSFEAYCTRIKGTGDQGVLARGAPLLESARRVGLPLSITGMDQTANVRENRLRRMAHRQG